MFLLNVIYDIFVIQNNQKGQQYTTFTIFSRSALSIVKGLDALGVLAAESPLARDFFKES
jgi:hypothetical protein